MEKIKLVEDLAIHIAFNEIKEVIKSNGEETTLTKENTEKIKKIEEKYYNGNRIVSLFELDDSGELYIYDDELYDDYGEVHEVAKEYYSLFKVNGDHIEFDLKEVIIKAHEIDIKCKTENDGFVDDLKEREELKLKVDEIDKIIEEYDKAHSKPTSTPDSGSEGDSAGDEDDDLDDEDVLDPEKKKIKVTKRTKLMDRLSYLSEINPLSPTELVDTDKVGKGGEKKTIIYCEATEDGILVSKRAYDLYLSKILGNEILESDIKEDEKNNIKKVKLSSEQVEIIKEKAKNIILEDKRIAREKINPSDLLKRYGKTGIASIATLYIGHAFGSTTSAFVAAQGAAGVATTFQALAATGLAIFTTPAVWSVAGAAGLIALGVLAKKHGLKGLAKKIKDKFTKKDKGKENTEEVREIEEIELNIKKIQEIKKALSEIKVILDEQLPEIDSYIKSCEEPELETNRQIKAEIEKINGNKDLSEEEKKKQLDILVEELEKMKSSGIDTDLLDNQDLVETGGFNL